jgi:hypothetical protein
MPLIVVVGRAAAKIFSQHDLVSDVFLCKTTVILFAARCASSQDRRTTMMGACWFGVMVYDGCWL